MCKNYALEPTLGRLTRALVTVICLIASGCSSSPVRNADSGVEDSTEKSELASFKDSEEFAPDDLSAAERQRWLLTSNVAGGITFRVDAVGESLRDENGIANYVIRPGSEKQLSTAFTNDLVALVRSTNGFDDGVRKRCEPGVSIGFDLTDIQTQADKVRVLTRLVLDFGCNRLTLVDQRSGSANRFIALTYFFDPSREAFIDLVISVLPDDKEVASLAE